MATSGDDDARRAASGKECGSCGTRLSDDQRYCLECGQRSGPLPAAVVARLPVLTKHDRGKEKEPAAVEPEPADEQKGGLLGYVLNPRAAAVAVMGMLAFGALLGAAISPLARSAGLYSILLEEPEPEPAPVEAEEPVAEPEIEPEPEEVPVPAEVSAAPIPELPAELPTEAPPELPPELPPTEELPEVKHVFLVVLGENGYEETFGKTSSAPYLSKALAEKGELLTNYYGVAGSDLANQIALVSGQGPTPETVANCPSYGDIVPGTESAEGQIEGNGCLYPATTKTLPSQLVESS